MKILALAIGVLMILLGLTGLVWPEGLVRLGHYSFTQTGIYVVAALRLAIGVVFFLAATDSRAPRTLRVIGILVCVAGVATALVSIERARELMAWWSSHGSGFVRIAAVAVVGLGSFIAYATAPRRL
jgi:uncharacterized membrane protein HdeD (DUF308 family)